ncbi:hypothetical protein BDY24DRAFT_411300 [Mrakia frigida]|uniref:DUF2456 domain-containing protein n=1 Tax=Mrakia frigida TaxID=29902 RepID=UPI003FCBF901
MSSIFFPFPLPLTGRQWFYVLFLQGIGAGLIDGGINFAIAYAMYHSQSDVRMWVFSKNTLAGDLGVTCLIQTAVSMLISSTLVHSDIHHSAIKPLPFVYPHVLHLPDPATLWQSSSDEHNDNSPPSDSSEKPTSSPKSKPKEGRLGYYWRMLLRFTFEGTERNIILEACGARDWFGRVGWTILQGLSLAVFFGLPLWLLAIVILGPIYKGGNVGNKWAPQVIKFVFAFLLGILTNPIIALMALGSQAQHHLIPLTVAPPLSPSTTLVPPSSPTLSQRPPLVANVSLLVPLGSPSTLDPPLPPPPATMGRPRASTNASSTGSIYSLGGTGGRAQRPRAGSRSSATGEGLVPPSFAAGGGRERSGSYGGRDRSGSSATNTGTGTRTGRERAGSLGGERKTIPSSWTSGAGGGPAGARLRELEREELEVPRESLEGRPSGVVGEEKEMVIGEKGGKGEEKSG